MIKLFGEDLLKDGLPDFGPGLISTLYHGLWAGLYPLQNGRPCSA